MDTLRGLAVMAMLTWHSADGWLRTDLRVGMLWEVLRQIGGLAAPLFLFVAGCCAALSWGAGPRRRDRRGWALRGAQLIVLGYLLRLQMWIVDGGAWMTWRGWPPMFLLAGAYGAAWWALTVYRQDPPSVLCRRTWAVGGFAIVSGFAGAIVVQHWFPDRLVMLFRIDILQCLGACLLGLALCAPAWEARRSAQWGWTAAALVASVTPALASGVSPGAAPAVLGYLTAAAASSEHPTMTLFPLFPWLAYFLGGYASGHTWRGGAVDGFRLNEGRIVRWGIVGTLAGCLVWTDLDGPTGLLPSDPTVRHLARMGYKLGWVLALAAVAVVLSRRVAWLGRLGRASLWIYWLHLQLCFGIVTLNFSRQLSLATWAAGWLALGLAMIVLARVFQPPKECARESRSRFAAIRPGRA